MQNSFAHATEDIPLIPRQAEKHDATARAEPSKIRSAEGRTHFHPETKTFLTQYFILHNNNNNKKNAAVRIIHTETATLFQDAKWNLTFRLSSFAIIHYNTLRQVMFIILM